jgi:hypothetical protein
MMLAYLAWTLAILGHLDQAQVRLNEALSEARRRKHAHTLADVLLSAGTIDGMTGAAETLQHADELLTLSSERALPLNLAWANVRAFQPCWCFWRRPTVGLGSPSTD